jgi:hypothetical protein
MTALNITGEFQWNIQNRLELFSKFAWVVGDGILYWYRVESNEFSGACYGLCATTCFNEVLTVMASSSKHLARQLRTQRYNKGINRISKWTRPVLECDIKNFEAAGVDLGCPTFEPVDKCIPELYEFLKCGDCPDLDNILSPDPCTGGINANICIPDVPFFWYTVYNNIQPVVSSGDAVVKGQVLGSIIDSSGLEFGVLDCLSISLDVTNIFHLSNIGNRAGGSPSSSVFNSQQIDYVLAHVFSPVDMDWCSWMEFFGNPTHTGPGYYLMNWLSDITVVIDCGPPHSATDALVFCAAGGSDVFNVVTSVTSNSVTVKHTRNGPLCCTSGSPALNIMAFLPNSEKIHTAASGLLPVNLHIETSLLQFGTGKLCYSAVSDSWRRHSHFQGWDCLCELSCRTNLGMTFWSLTFHVNKLGKRSVLSVMFFPNSFIKVGKYLCEFVVKGKSLQCEVATQSVIIKDDLGVFKSPVIFLIKA